MQQWARRCDRITQPLGSPHKRARIRQYIFSGDDNLHFLLASDAVPTLLHLSVFLFFAGLLILLRQISHIVFNAVVVWVVLCVMLYAYITFLPIFRPGSPYYAPISSMVLDILYPLFQLLFPATGGIRNMDVRRPTAHLLKRVEEKAEEIVLGKSPKLDASILESLLVTLDEDGAREKFFEAIPGFCDSKLVHVDGVNKSLSPTFFTNFRHTVNQFLNQTLSSDSISELVRSRRLLACLNATHRLLGGRAGMSITDQIIRMGDWNEMPPSPKIGHILRRWRNSTDSSISLIGSCIIARIIASVKTRDDTWMALARPQLGVTEEVLRRYLEHGDSILLANLIKTMRLFFEKGLQYQGILQSISEFDVKATLPELRHDFCTLWDEIVETSKHTGDCIFILDEICHVHVALHPTTVGALHTSTIANNDGLLPGSSYELCADAPSHHPSIVSRQVAAVPTSSSSSPLGVPPLSPPLQHDETKINPHQDTSSLLDPLSPLRELPVEVRKHVPPALGHSYFTTTSHTLATPRDVSVSDPGVIIVAGGHDDQDMNAHNPHQSDPPALDISTSTSPSRPGKSVV